MLSSQKKILFSIITVLIFGFLFLLIDGVFIGVITTLNIAHNLFLIVLFVFLSCPIGFIIHSILSSQQENNVRSTLFFLFFIMIVLFLAAPVFIIRIRLYILCFTCLALSAASCLWLGILLKKQKLPAFTAFVFTAIIMLIFLYYLFILYFFRTPTSTANIVAYISSF